MKCIWESRAKDLVTPAANQIYIYDGQYRITTSIKSVGITSTERKQHTFQGLRDIHKNSDYM